MGTRPLVFFDTNVARKLKEYPQDERSRFWAWMGIHRRYAIAPTVIAEILKSLALEPDRHLQDVRQELAALRGPGNPIVLPLQGIFLARTLFGIEREHPHASARTMAQVLEAGRRLKRVVRQGDQVLLVENPQYPAIVLNYIIDPLQAGQESMSAALERTRQKKAAPLEPDEWAKQVLEAVNITATPERARTLAEACKAAYFLQRFLWTQAIKNYNPRKHPGDWMDTQLLLYLASAEAIFVTCERQLPERIRGCGQEHRVLSFDDLWCQVIGN